MAACPTLLLPSTNGWFWIRKKPSAAPCRQTRVEVLAAEGLSRLRACRFQCSKVAKQRLLATLFHDEAVEE